MTPEGFTDKARRRRGEEKKMSEKGRRGEEGKGEEKGEMMR